MLRGRLLDERGERKDGNPRRMRNLFAVGVNKEGVSRKFEIAKDLLQHLGSLFLPSKVFALVLNDLIFWEMFE
jgi:hypothetical protein